MPITIVVPDGNVAVGPGLWIYLTSSFIGPLPAGSFFDLTFTEQSPSEEPAWTAHIPTVSPFTTPQLGITFGTTLTNVNEFELRNGETTHITAVLNDGTGVVDTGSADLTWDAVSGVPALIMSQKYAGGLTSGEAAQLSQVETNTTASITTPAGVQQIPLAQLLSVISLDALTLGEVTSGPQTGFVGHTLVSGTTGVLVRITNIPGNFYSTTPDDGWYPQDLAVVRVYRGTDLIERIPIHTVSQWIKPIPGVWTNLPDLPVTVELLPPDMSIQVYFATGVYGRIYIDTLP